MSLKVHRARRGWDDRDRKDEDASVTGSVAELLDTAPTGSDHAREILSRIEALLERRTTR